jgi:hypothetical protein
MLKINYEKMLSDFGLIDAFKKVLKEQTKLTDQEINGFIKSSIDKHSNNINVAMKGINDVYVNKKDSETRDNEFKNIDQQLDEIINQAQNNYKQFEKENEIK